MVQWEDFGLVLVYSLGSLVWLFVLTKLMGNRQMSQLTLFDYIIGISIGSIAAEMASHGSSGATGASEPMRSVVPASWRALNG